MYYTYFAKSLKNDKIYVGYSSKLPAERVEEHNKGANIWSKNNGPFKLIYFEIFYCKQDASTRENFYKTGIGRRIKKAIIQEMDD